MNTLTTSSPLRGFIFAGIFSALASGFAGVASASDPAESQSVIVHYGDLNLGNPQGAASPLQPYRYGSP